MTKLTRAVEAYVDDFDALQLVNVMWSFGKLNINPGTNLAHRICDRLALLLVDLSPQVRTDHHTDCLLHIGGGICKTASSGSTDPAHYIRLPSCT